METPLEAARRHAAEGKRRIARQEALIAQLIADGHRGLVTQAREISTVMHELKNNSRNI